MRARLYTLRTVNGKPVLDFVLGLNIINETTEKIEVQLSTGIATIIKKQYLNTMKVYDNGSVFFLVCTKAVNQDFAFKKLLEYSMVKIDKRVEKLQSLKEDYKKLVAA